MTYVCVYMYVRVNYTNIILYYSITHEQENMYIDLCKNERYLKCETKKLHCFLILIKIHMLYKIYT